MIPRRYPAQPDSAQGRFYRPIRRIMPDFGALDLTPMVVLLIIYILRNILIPSLSMSL